MIKSMVEVFTTGLMGEFTMENGSMENSMEEAHIKRQVRRRKEKEFGKKEEE